MLHDLQQVTDPLGRSDRPQSSNVCTSQAIWEVKGDHFKGLLYGATMLCTAVLWNDELSCSQGRSGQG
jgi:hypothetical protein